MITLATPLAPTALDAAALDAAALDAAALDAAALDAAALDPSVSQGLAGAPGVPALSSAADETPERAEARDLGGAWAPAGHVTEVAGRAGSSAARTVAIAAAREVQSGHAPVAWVGPRAWLPHTPDLVAAGLDLGAFVAVAHAAGEGAARLRSAELLLRSGGFGLVIVDLTDVPRLRGVAAALARLRGLAREHHAHALLLVEASAEAPSLGAPISRRLAPRRAEAASDGVLALALRVTKDRLRTPLALRARLPEDLLGRGSEPSERAEDELAEVLPFARHVPRRAVSLREQLA